MMTGHGLIVLNDEPAGQRNITVDGSLHNVARWILDVIPEDKPFYVTAFVPSHSRVGCFVVGVRYLP